MIEKFKQIFIEANMVLLCKAELKEVSNLDKLEYVRDSIVKQINWFVDSLVSFYSLDEQIRGERDLKRELLFNLVANSVLEGELYFLVYNLTSVANEDKIQLLKKMMNDKAFLENCLTMDTLALEPQYKFDVNYRNKYAKIDSDIASYSV